MEQPKLLVVADSFLPRWDGVARVLKELLPLMSDSFEIHLAFPDYPGERLELPGVHYVTFPLLPLLRTGDVRWGVPLRSRVRREVGWADLVWTHAVGPLGGACLREAVRTDTPVVSMVHSVEWEVYAQHAWFGKTLVEWLWRRITRARYNRVQRVLTPSATTRAALVDNGVERPVLVTPLGVCTTQFTPLSPEEKTRERAALGLVQDLPIVGFVGRFGPEKSLGTLLAAHELAQERCPSQLLLVGGHPRELPRHSSTSRVSVVGPTQTPERYYQVMDLYCLTSLTESFPLGILEAMACGVAPVSTPVGAVPEYLVSGTNGVLVPPKDVDALTEVLVEMLQDRTQREAMGKKARETVEEGFRWEQVGLRIGEHLKEVLNKT